MSGADDDFVEYARASASQLRRTAYLLCRDWDLAADLTQRETEVLTEIAAGLSNAEIARKLVISDTTVKTHINHLLAKTGARDRAQLVGYAFRAGLAR